MQMIASLIMALALFGMLAYGMDEELRDHVLTIHNDYRMNVQGACQMERMEYDMDLERQAAAWANRCVFKHEIKKGRGENLAWNSAEDNETVLMTKAAKSWYDEVNMYSYGQYSCGSSCHYTQMVWDRTNKVGCATKRCSYLTYAYSNAWYFVCFYTPSGNMNGVKPYQTSCTTPCKEGQTQDSDGLCVGTNRSTETGSDESETNNGNEENNGNDEEEETTGTAATTTTEAAGGETMTAATGSISTTEGVCEDKHSSCVEWARVGECTKNPSYMHRDCRLACAFCGDECKDVHGSCANWAADSQCTKNPNYMLHYCRLSCNACS